ncbi:MAG: T9SS type A sorting domain-containing protein, partial [Chitinophagaceae bacterium]
CNAFGGFRYPRVKMRIRDGFTNLIITEISTADIVSNTWQQYGLKFVAPASYTQLIIELINDANGGCGNDLVLDDIMFGTCDPTPVVSTSVVSGCMGGPADFTSTISDPTAIGGTVQYQWQVASAAAGPWANIAGATAANYTIPAVAAADTGKYYRVLIAAAGNINDVNCRFASAAIILQGRLLSVAATGATKNKDNVCPLIQVTLGVTGGSLGYGAQWVWYAGSCSGTPIGTGASIVVSAPFATTTYYVRAEGICNVTACQSVTIFISCNIDKDRDGIPDYVESYIPAALTNAFNTAYAGYKDINNDHVNDDFQADGDSDNDGIPNYLDPTFPGRIDTNSDGVDDRFDMDKDGIINMLDLDSDNDGIPDVVEAGGVDADGDGRIDNYSDSDNDGLSQQVDLNNIGASGSGNGLGFVDLDGDGRANAIDLDSDGDGIPDVIEVYGTDTNNNAVIDGFVDANSDGLHDSYINASSLLRTGADINNDGRADSYPNKNFDNDGRANPYDLDSDADGIVDVIEAGFADSNSNGFEDGAVGSDGWSNVIRARPAPLVLRNTDAVGRPDYLDIDSDGDGIPDNIEGQTTLGYRFPAYADSDNDGLDNAYDLAPHTASFGGAGILVTDRDGDGTPDYRDLDTDADGQPDIVEGHDWNLNGVGDEITTPLGVDTDGDGLDDRFDLINSTTNLKGTSIYMGNSGSLTGDPSPASRATVQRTLSSGGCTFERDWRCVSSVLPISRLQLNAVDNNNAITLNWTIISSIAIQSFEVERSLDNSTYQRIASQAANVRIDQLENLSGTDNIASLNSTVVYYRIKAIAQNGQVKYSNIVIIRKDRTITPFSISPNPANEVASVRFYTDKETVVHITIRDFTGKLVYQQKVKALKGNNVHALTNLSKYSDGVYHVQLMIDNDIQSAKLIIQN